MDFLSLLIVLIFSIVVHEVAHAWVALREGDDTAEQLGRITLNPLSHLDLVGSFLVPVALHLLSSGLLFGWAKPVPIDPRKFRRHPSSDIKVSLAGIASNLLLAVVFTLVALAAVKLQAAWGGGEAVLGSAFRLARFAIFINLILSVFNLIPIPPLDGSHVVYHLLPRAWRAPYRRAGRYGLLVLIALVFLYPPFFEDFVLLPVFALMDLADSFIDLWI